MDFFTFLLYRNVTGKSEEKKFESLKKRIIAEPETLFYIVHDEGILGLGFFQDHLKSFISLMRQLTSTI